MNIGSAPTICGSSIEGPSVVGVSATGFGLRPPPFTDTPTTDSHLDCRYARILSVAAHSSHRLQTASPGTLPPFEPQWSPDGRTARLRGTSPSSSWSNVRCTAAENLTFSRLGSSARHDRPSSKLRQSQFCTPIHTGDFIIIITGYRRLVIKLLRTVASQFTHAIAGAW